MDNWFDISEEEITETIDLLMSSFEVVKPQKKIKAILEDEKDNRILECAVEANAKCIISGDKHLLKLKKYKSIEIIKTNQL